MKKKIIAPLVYTAIFISLITFVLIKIYMPNYETEPYFKYVTDYKANQCNLLYEDILIDGGYNASINDEKIYLSYEFFRDNFDKYLYFDELTNKLTLTTKDSVIRLTVNEGTYSVNSVDYDLESPIFVDDESSVLFLPYDFFSAYYPIAAHYSEESSIVSVTRRDVSYTFAEVKNENAYLRYEPDIKSPVIETLNLNDSVELLDETDKWYKVKAYSGFIGYIAASELSQETLQKEADFMPEDRYVSPMYQASKGKINLIWDQLFTEASYEAAFRKVPKNGLDVLSPTWFSITSANGEIKSLANHDYVDWAHENGYQVWALVDNDFIGKDMRENTSKFLGNTDTRQRIIDELIFYAKEYNLDGINIDFESVPEADGRNYVQFMKEAAIYMRNAGLVVSVDVYVPMPWTAHYNRQELGIICDYVMVMSYDEHWSSSPVAGSVASIGFVEDSIINMLKEVPNEKILLGLPYYTYRWTETEVDGKIDVASKAYGMNDAYALAQENKAEFIWDGGAGQYYTEYINDGKTIKLWLEDERSIELKAQFVNEYDIAGVAGWKRGLEKEEIWNVLYRILGK